MPRHTYVVEHFGKPVLSERAASAITATKTTQDVTQHVTGRKFVVPGCKRDAETLDTNPENFVSCLLVVWPPFGMVVSWYGVVSGCGFCPFFGRPKQLATSRGPGGLLEPHILGPMKIAIDCSDHRCAACYGVFPRCGGTVDFLIFAFSERTTSIFRTLSLLVLRVQPPESTRTTRSIAGSSTTRRRGATSRQGHLPCHFRRCGQQSRPCCFGFNRWRRDVNIHSH